VKVENPVKEDHMNRRLWTYAAVQLFATVLALILLSAVTKTQAKGVAQAQRSAPQPCPTGPGVQLAAAGNKTIIMPPSLGDSSAAAYSHGVRVGDMLFLAGHTGTAENETANFDTQARRAFTQLEAVLKSSGGSLNDIVTMTVFMTDIRRGPEFLKIRKEVFGRDFPASALIGVSHLVPVDGMLEIQATALLPCRDTATR
jgi:2-iminobutanoate/2-iminopropanoate deaminase